MTEVEILNNSQLGFIQNAIYTVAIVIMTFIAFRLARVANEKKCECFRKNSSDSIWSYGYFFFHTSKFLLVNATKRISLQSIRIKGYGS